MAARAHLTASEVALPGDARLRVRDSDPGGGEALVFIGALLSDGRLWDRVVDELASEYRCVVPDWPLGAHRIAMPSGTDLTPPGLARIVGDTLEALDLHGVTLVGNDTGGAVAQIVATQRPERLGRLVLLPCDAFENFLPPLFRPLQYVPRVPGATRVLLEALRLKRLQRLPMTFGWLSRRPIDPALTTDWLRPARTDAAVRRDLEAILTGIDRRHTLEAAERLRTFDRPALVAWAPEDKVFPFAHAQRLASLLPDARLERIEDSYTLVGADQPVRTAELIGTFVRDTAPRAVSA